VATGEHCHNRVMFKQLLQAEAIDFCQFDSAGLDGLNEVMIVLLMAAKVGSYCSLLVGVRNTALSRAWPQLVRRMASNKHGASRESDDSLGGATQQNAS
jgi:hypothetical protein